ncbi:MAG: sulfotransferase [Leptolyngbyaceae bacterium]|nr:sulfotransferase [Leptolyngbyaceae bacterium]
MTLPNFLIIGAMKAGTTSLYRYLKQHPQVFMSPVKEPNFFALEGEVLDDPRVTVTDLPSYQGLFTGVTDEVAIGEASVRYLYSPKAAARIHHYIPDAKLLVVLRNPVERAFSAYVYQFSRGSDLLTDFGEALAAEPERIAEEFDCWWHYRAMGFYHAQLQQYYQYFAPEQIKVCLYEDLCQQPQQLITEMFEFLGVDPTFQPAIAQQHNATRIPKNRLIHNFLTKPHPIKEIFKPFLQSDLRYKIVKGLRQRNLADPAKVDPAFKPTLSPTVRHALIDDYREDILRLQTLLGRDLSAWLEA